MSLLRSGEYTTAEVGDLLGVARSTVYRAVARNAARQTQATATKPASGSDVARKDAGTTYRPRHLATSDGAGSQGT